MNPTDVSVPIQPQQPVPHAAPQATQNQSRSPADYCSGLRKAYNGILSGLSSNNVLAIVAGGAPFYYLLVVSIYGSTARSLFGTATWIFMSVLLLAWILACVAAWKTMPNLLSISVFIYTSMGH